MKVLITGGLGYLGGELIKYLLSDEQIEKITIYDKGVYGVTHIAPLVSNRLKIVIGDIREDKLEEYITSADCIVHLASLVGAPLVDRKPVEAFDTNINGTKKITNYVSKSQRYIFASTGSCYGKVEGVCTENTRISPLSSYGKHKALGEDIVLQAGGIALRFATVYGCSYRTRNDLYINSMIQKAITDGSVVLYEGNARRTFMHVSDAARAIHTIIKNDNLKYNIYNVGDSALGYSKKEICEEINKLLKFNIIENEFSKDFDQRDYVVKYERLDEIGFRSVAKINDVLPSMLNYYKSIFESGYANG